MRDCRLINIIKGRGVQQRFESKNQLILQATKFLTYSILIIPSSGLVANKNIHLPADMTAPFFKFRQNWIICQFECAPCDTSRPITALLYSLHSRWREEAEGLHWTEWPPTQQASAARRHRPVATTFQREVGRVSDRHTACERKVRGQQRVWNQRQTQR